MNPVYIVVLRSVGTVQYFGPFPTIRAAIEHGRTFAPDIQPGRNWNWAVLDQPEPISDTASPTSQRP